jgi:uncharacterized protein
VGEVKRIEQDQRRFRKIVHGMIRKDFRKYVKYGGFHTQQGNKPISVNIPKISLPRFKYGQRQTGGVGMGPGEIGTTIGTDEEQEGRKTDSQPGQHAIEVEVEIDDLAQILGEELNLPHLEERKKGREIIEGNRYTGIRRIGPEGLRHTRRTFKRNLLRQIASGTYNPDKPILIPRREDKMYRAAHPHPLPKAQYKIFYMMDISGSMGIQQKELVRMTSFWISAWIRSEFRRLNKRLPDGYNDDEIYIVHDTKAKEVQRHPFFHLSTGGGTMISSAYDLAANTIDERCPPDDWNLYFFHFSDGDNWGKDDTKECLSLLENRILPAANQFAYTQVKSKYGSGQFIKELKTFRWMSKKRKERMVLTEMNTKDDVLPAIKRMLGGKD